LAEVHVHGAVALVDVTVVGGPDVGPSGIVASNFEEDEFRGEVAVSSSIRESEGFLSISSTC
jgi:hypothetical protein